MANRIEDEVFMRQALDLAREGSALTSPNPMVGALVVRDAAILSRGYHLYEGVKHAEVLALEQAGEQAQIGRASCRERV